MDIAHNGVEALQLIQKSFHDVNNNNYYGLIFMDLSMPIMNGYEASD